MIKYKAVNKNLKGFPSFETFKKWLQSIEKTLRKETTL